jgi:hypothetical protein
MSHCARRGDAREHGFPAVGKVLCDRCQARLERERRRREQRERREAERLLRLRDRFERRSGRAAA